VQDIHGRTFGVWTLVTCLLCVMSAFNLHNEELYLVTYLSFVIALGYFSLECFVYRTMAVKNLGTLTFFAGLFSSPRLSRFPFVLILLSSPLGNGCFGVWRWTLNWFWLSMPGGSILWMSLAWNQYHGSAIKYENWILYIRLGILEFRRIASLRRIDEQVSRKLECARWSRRMPKEDWGRDF